MTILELFNLKKWAEKRRQKAYRHLEETPEQYNPKLFKGDIISALLAIHDDAEKEIISIDDINEELERQRHPRSLLLDQERVDIARELILSWANCQLEFWIRPIQLDDLWWRTVGGPQGSGVCDGG
ncbi:hypothetical protein MMC14_006429 [Varicellaria rhodocarpa]|nr:hypothetical protein [Varicellaria rhodocarpa]